MMHSTAFCYYSSGLSELDDRWSMMNRWLMVLFVCVWAGYAVNPLVNAAGDRPVTPETETRQSPMPVVPLDLYIFREGYTQQTPLTDDVVGHSPSPTWQEVFAVAAIDATTLEVVEITTFADFDIVYESTFKLDMYTGELSDRVMEELNDSECSTPVAGPMIDVMGRSVQSRVIECSWWQVASDGARHDCTSIAWLHPEVEVSLRRDVSCVITLNGAFPSHEEHHDWTVDTNLELGDVPATTCAVRGKRHTKLRVGPEADALIVGSLSFAQIVEIDGQTTGSDGFVWWRLVDDASWIRSDRVEPIYDCGGVPIVESETISEITG